MEWYPKAQLCLSPHCSQRPEGVEVGLLVLHNISLPPNYFGGNYIEQFFQGRLDAAEHPFFATIEGLHVSAHLGIKRDGRVVQFVPFSKRAWHAGVSSWQGRENCNDYSIGIELEGSDNLAYSDAQYQALKAVTLYIQHYYPRVSLGRIVGHSDIAPGRKTDPGPAFDWARFRQSIHTYKDDPQWF